MPIQQENTLLRLQENRMSDTFELIKAKLEKSSKGTRMTILSNSQLAGEVDKIKTPTYDLNRILSGSLYHGVVSRTHTLLVGPEASGKSSFMAINVAKCQELGYTPIIIDAEGAWTPEFCIRWGIDPSKMFIIPSMWVEDIMVELAKIINEGWQKMVIVLDSIGALESDKMIADGEKNDIKADQGGLQKKIKRLLKMMVNITKIQNSISYSSGHYYGNPTGYGDPEQIGGGKYPRLAADYIVTLKKSPIYEFPAAKKVADKGKILGNRIYAATIKNRYYPPFQESVVEIEYTKGVNKIAGLVDVALDMGIITSGGAWYTIPCLNKKIQGEDNLYKMLLEPGLDITPFLDEIEKNLKITGYSTVNNELEVLDVDETTLKQEIDQEEPVEEVIPPKEEVIEPVIKKSTGKKK